MSLRFLSKANNSGKEHGIGTVAQVSTKYVASQQENAEHYAKKDYDNRNDEVLEKLRKAIEKAFERNCTRQNQNSRKQKNKRWKENGMEFKFCAATRKLELRLSQSLV